MCEDFRHTAGRRQAVGKCKESVPASWSARGGSKGWWWWRRTGRGGARAGALLALRIKAEESRESPVEQLRRAEEVGSTGRRYAKESEEGQESRKRNKERVWKKNQWKRKMGGK